MLCASLMKNLSGVPPTLLDDGELQGFLGVKKLAEKSLIEITTGEHIKIHSLVVQTAKAIVNKESDQRPSG